MNSIGKSRITLKIGEKENVSAPKRTVCNDDNKFSKSLI